ncbi:MAG: hypothetical protein LBG27_06965 [Spirochaetaceae bacterium]|nr:hypothetical protein [Spirochaetaceae bacterium]
MAAQIKQMNTDKDGQQIKVCAYPPSVVNVIEFVIKAGGVAGAVSAPQRG